MVMRINRIVGRRFPTAEFKMTVLCQARHTTSLTSCHVERWSSSSFPLFFWVSVHWQVPVTVLQKSIHMWQWLLLSPSWSISLCLFFHHSSSSISEHFVFHLSILSFLCIWALSFTCIPHLWLCLPPSLLYSAPPRCNCSETGFHFYDYNRGQNAYAFRFPLACVTEAVPSRGR